MKKVKNNKIRFGVYLSTLILTSCSTNLAVDGSYHNQKNSKLEILLDKNNFLIIDRTDNGYLPFKCCDTISFGKWEKIKKNDFLFFKSPISYDNFVLNTIVKEKNSIPNDSVTIFINNPIEEHYRKFKEKYREMYYTIEISSNDADFDLILAQKKWETNKISFFKPKNIKINDVTVNIVPKSDMSVRSIQSREIRTFPYEIKSLSNVLEVGIPDLNYLYISMQRLDSTYIKIEKNKLIWENQVFIKKE